jgi:hypothetical protein
MQQAPEQPASAPAGGVDDIMRLIQNQMQQQLQAPQDAQAAATDAAWLTAASRALLGAQGEAGHDDGDNHARKKQRVDDATSEVGVPRAFEHANFWCMQWFTQSFT